jgi:hypothetical protein
MSNSTNNANTLQAQISAANTFSDSIRIADSSFGLSVYGTFSGTVSLQRKLNTDPPSEWHTIKTYTTVAEDFISAIGSWDYRIGIETGNYTSGTAKITASESTNDVNRQAISPGGSDASGAAATAQAAAIQAAEAVDIARTALKMNVVAGAAAGDHTLAGITATTTLVQVLYLIGAGTAVTDVSDLTSEFSVAAGKIHNTTTNTTGGKLLVTWLNT